MTEGSPTFSDRQDALRAERKSFNEPELPDDYPIYGDYWYVADGKPVRSDWHGITARQFKRHEGVKILCRCDLPGRDVANAYPFGHKR